MKLGVILIFFLTTVTTDIYGQEYTDNQKIVVAVEELPSFTGGPDSLKSFIKKNLKYPSGTKDFAGTVFVAFSVHPDGSITDIAIIKGLCDQCDRNAVELVKSMPLWIPGTSDNVKVKMRTVIPIRFEL